VACFQVMSHPVSNRVPHNTRIVLPLCHPVLSSSACPSVSQQETICLCRVNFCLFVDVTSDCCGSQFLQKSLNP
jgi:hypothetical protein